jgi:hypothetical protein
LEEDHNISYAFRYTGISRWVGREGIHRTEDVDDGTERGLGGSGYHSDYDLGNEPESDSTREANGITSMEAEYQFYNNMWSGLNSLSSVAHLVITKILRVAGPRWMRAISPAQTTITRPFSYFN